jgi:hypothetical protein
VAVRVFDVKPEELLEVLKKGKHSPGDRDPFKIRIRYDSLKYSARKQIGKFLLIQTFQRLRNTTSWILKQSN